MYINAQTNDSKLVILSLSTSRKLHYPVNSIIVLLFCQNITSSLTSQCLSLTISLLWCPASNEYEYWYLQMKLTSKKTRPNKFKWQALYLKWLFQSLSLLSEVQNLSELIAGGSKLHGPEFICKKIMK